ncbi:MAG: flagellar basal body-associated FliL family protein [Deltaproteobacteria bacterium]
MAGKEDKEMAPETSPKGGKKKGKAKLLIIAVLVLAVGGGAAWYFKVHRAAAKESGEKTAQAGEKGESSGHGEHGAHGEKEGEGGPKTLYYKLEPFILNLADIDSNRYLKVSVSLEFDTPSSMEEAERRVPQIRDSMILLMSSLTYGDIHSVAGKITLQSEIQNRLNSILQPGAVKRVYFTDFVVQ